MRALVVEDVDELIKASLLLKEIRGRRLGGFFFQSEMQTFMTAVLLGVSRNRESGPIASGLHISPPGAFVGTNPTGEADNFQVARRGQKASFPCGSN